MIGIKEMLARCRLFLSHERASRLHAYEVDNALKKSDAHPVAAP